jgi:uncharacterized SAM-binding protein YcdF (DUF218 family)
VKLPLTSPGSFSAFVGKYLRRLLWLAVLCLLFSVLCFVFRSPLLRAAATAWMVNEPPSKADAIVVLGGGAQFRSFEAARMYHAGLAPAILVMNPELWATDQLGVTIPEAELVRRVLLSNAVPAEAIHLLGTNLISTFGEAMTLKQWSKESQAKSFLIPTGPFHSRRVRWVFHKHLGTSVRITVTTINPELCQRWWKDERTLIEFQNEVFKSLYYHLKY